MDTFQVGDYVRSVKVNRKGVIKEVMTDERFKDNPYWVFWENGYDDWYSSKNLVLDTQDE